MHSFSPTAIPGGYTFPNTNTPTFFHTHSTKIHQAMAFKLHIGVLAFPFGTHAPPLLALVRRLAAAAPAALFTFFNSPASNAALFKDSGSDPFDNIRVRDVWDGTPDGRAFAGSHFEAIGLFLKASPGNFEKAIREAEEGSGLRICCLITDAFLWFASDMAEERGVPWVAFWTAGSCSLSSHVYTPQILRAVGSTEKEEQALSFIPGLEMATSSDIPPEVFLDNSPSPLAVTINNMVEKLPSSTAVVLNSFEEIDPVITEDLKSKFQHFLNVGPSILAASPAPASLDEKTGCLSWLDSQKPPKSVVYISFGTVITPPENELAALAEALEICRFPFLWSLKDQAAESLPHGFLDRNPWGRIVPWAPQQRVLAHESVGVFITHCGWNSIVESISGSVPLICRPFFGDQKLNSRMVQDSWRIGVRVKGGVFTKSETVECLRELMGTEKGVRIRENVRVMREKALAAVKPGGSSCKNFKKLLQIIGASEST